MKSLTENDIQSKIFEVNSILEILSMYDIYEQEAFLDTTKWINKNEDADEKKRYIKWCETSNNRRNRGEKKMLTQLIESIKEVFNPPQEEEESLKDKIVIKNHYNLELTEHLINREHNRKINIHNLGGYLEMEEKNFRQYTYTNDALQKKYNHDFQIEVLKEIALRELFKKNTTKDIEQLFMEYNQLPPRVWEKRI